MPAPTYRWDDWLPGAERLAVLLQRLPGVATTKRAYLGSAGHLPPQPRIVVVDTHRLMVKFIRPPWTQLLLVDLIDGVSAPELASTIEQLLGKYHLHLNTLKEDAVADNAEVYGDATQWITGAEDLAHKLAAIPGVMSIEQSERQPRQEAGPPRPSFRETGDGFDVHAVSYDERQTLHVTLGLRGDRSTVKAHIIRLIDQYRNDPRPQPESQPATRTIARRSPGKIEMNFTPIEGVMPLSHQLAATVGVDHVVISAFVKRTGGNDTRQPTAQPGEGHVIVTVYAPTHQQQILVYGEKGRSNEQLLDNVLRVIRGVAPSLSQTSPEPTSTSPERTEHRPVASTPTVATNTTLRLTAKQAETYAFVLSLMSDADSECAIEGLSTKIARRFNDSGTNRYMSLVHKGLIVRRGKELVVLRRTYSGAAETNGAHSAPTVQATAPRPAPVLPPTPSAPAPAPAPPPTPTPVTPPAATPLTELEVHFDFLRQHWSSIVEARDTIANFERHQQALGNLGWEVIDVDGEPLLRRRRSTT